MSSCKRRNAIKPYNKKAIAVANNIQSSCNTYEERKKWMDEYIIAGGAWECADPKGAKPNSTTQPCTNEANKSDDNKLVIKIYDSENDKLLGISILFEPIELDIIKEQQKKVQSSDQPIADTSVINITPPNVNIYNAIVYSKMINEQYSFSMETKKDGIAKTTNKPTGKYQVTIAQEGYQLFKKLLSVNRGNNSYEFELKKQTYLYFAIYYKEEDDAFKLAANTWKNNIMSNKNKDIHFFIDKEVETENDFKNAWKVLYKEATDKNMIVLEGRIFSHASKTDETETDGLEFAPDLTNQAIGSTLEYEEIKNLEVLPWSKSGQLILHGCNTGLERGGWSPAQIFCNSQNVTTIGQAGYAYFSEKDIEYIEFNGLSQGESLFLWAYERRKNAFLLLGSGEKIPGNKFTPK